MMEFLSWDDEIPNLWKKNHIPNHQPDVPDCPPPKKTALLRIFHGYFLMEDTCSKHGTGMDQQTNRGVWQPTKFQVFLRPTEGKHIFGFFLGYSMI